LRAAVTLSEEREHGTWWQREHFCVRYDLHLFLLRLQDYGVTRIRLTQTPAAFL
jgi:hypothetical protein